MPRPERAAAPPKKGKDPRSKLAPKSGIGPPGPPKGVAPPKKPK